MEVFFILVSLASLILLLIFIPRLWALRHAPGATELLFISLACSLWSFGYMLEILVPGLSAKLFWAKFEYLGIAMLTAWVLLFFIRYTGFSTSLNLRHMAALMVIPALTILFTFTNELHSWVWTTITLQPNWSLAPLSLGHGGWFWVQITYSYLLLLGATALLVQFILRARSLYLAQSLIMFAAMLIPWVGNAFYLVGYRPGPNLDLTPLCFTLTNIMLVIGFVRFRLLDILPVAYSSIFRFMVDGVMVLDSKCRIVDINPAATRIFPRPDSLAPDRPAAHHHPDGNDPFIGRSIAELLPGRINPTTGLIASPEMELQVSSSPESKSRAYALRSTPILDRHQEVTGQVLIFTDITERKNAEEQMHLQVTALESAENGIVITDPQGRIEWANPAFTRLTGYELDEALGQNLRILKSGRHSDEHYKKLWETVKAGKVWQGEMINRRKDGSLYNEEMTITPLSQTDGQIAHFIAIKQDVSERKKAEEAMKLAHEQAVESNRLKTQLLANVSHDMRTPLGAIMGFSDMLCDGVYGEMTTQQKVAVMDIQDSANQLLLFVNNMIGQAQFETGKILMKPKPFPVQELIEVCQSNFTPTADKKGLNLIYEIDPALPQDLTGDVYWLRQIVQNLVSNAVKYTDQGSVKLRFYLPDENSWAIQVIDTGIGISAEAQKTIFEPFRQIDSSRLQERSGSGLGLAIVKELTTLMGGQISLVSAPGSGSTFTVCLPIYMENEIQ